MEIINYINQNIPIWCILKGDHACQDVEKFLSASIIKSPNFIDNKENELRKIFLKETKNRKWLFDFIENKSFALVKLEKKDIVNVLSVWNNVPLYRLAKEYKRAFLNNKKVKIKGVVKDKGSVREVNRRMKTLPSVSLDTNWMIDFNPSIDYHRCIWMKRKDGQYQIVDGTHRTVATIWKYFLKNKKTKMPPWYAIMFEE